MIILIMGLVIVSVGLGYVVVISIGVYGVTSVIALRVYGWIILGGRMIVLLLFYLVGNIVIEVNWKMLAIRVLPLPVFFMKVIRS